MGLKKPKLREVDKLAIYKHDREVELGSTEKQPQVRRSGHSATLQLATFPQKSSIGIY